MKKDSNTTKRIVWACLVNGFLWVWCSYLLAYLGRDQIAESLSQVAVTQIIGVVFVYGVKSLFENMSKHNKWPDKSSGPSEEAPAEEITDEITADEEMAQWN